MRFIIEEDILREDRAKASAPNDDDIEWPGVRTVHRVVRLDIRVAGITAEHIEREMRFFDSKFRIHNGQMSCDLRSQKQLRSDDCDRIGDNCVIAQGKRCHCANIMSTGILLVILLAYGRLVQRIRITQTLVTGMSNDPRAKASKKGSNV